jgi:2,3-bisphosphoglycerate-independent phosphoglycerate mutase
MAKRENQKKVYLHLFSDGRDSPPKSVLNLLEKLEEEIKKRNIGAIASLTGRYYAMNRQENWDRTEKTYQAITGQGEEIKNLEEEIKKVYNRNLNAEFIPPLIIDKTKAVKDNDSIIFFNFREDRARQITEPFVEPNFKHFPIKNFKNLFVTTLTCYREDLKTAVAFPPQKVENPLGKVLADYQKTQLRIAETEKYAHVTYFFNGLKEQPFPNEYRILIPSQNIINPAEKPAMMAEAITDRALTALNESNFDFILINFANPDIIAHTGDYQATIEAIKVVDQQIGRLLKSVLAQNHVLIITADHGNAESLIDLKTGQTETKHNMSPVPIYLVANEFKRKKTNSEIKKYEIIGLLSDVAPTILDLMQIPKPTEMTGQSLIPLLL